MQKQSRTKIEYIFKIKYNRYTGDISHIMNFQLFRMSASLLCWGFLCYDYWDLKPNHIHILILKHHVLIKSSRLYIGN